MLCTKIKGRHTNADLNADENHILNSKNSRAISPSSLKVSQKVG